MTGKRVKKVKIEDGRYIGTYITPELMKRFEDRAAQEMRSKAQMLRIYIERGLRQDAAAREAEGS